MSKPISPVQYRRRIFITSLGVIILVISLFEAMIMLLFDALPGWGIILEPVQETLLDTALLTLLGIPCLWLFSLRPLALKIESQHAKVEEQIRLNSELQLALDIHGLVSIADSQGLIIHANEKFCSVSGYKKEELIGQDHRIVNSGKHDLAYFRNLWDTITAGQVWQGEMCNRSKNGHYYWVDSTIVPLLDDAGMPRQYIAIRRDVTVLKNNEQNLIALRRALDASSEMIVITDAIGCIQYVNPALCSFTGWNENELIGQSAGVMDNPAANQDVLTDMRNVLTAGKSWFGRVQSRRRVQDSAGDINQPSYWAELSVTPIFNNDKVVTGYVQIQRDVSMQIAREELLQSEREDAAARMVIAEALQQIKPMDERFIQVLKSLLDLKGFSQQHKGIVFLKTQGTDHLDRFVLQGEFDAAFLDDMQRLAAEGIFCGQIWLSAEKLVCGNCGNDPSYAQRSAYIEPHGHCLIPIASGNENFGALFLYTDFDMLQTESRRSMLVQVGEMMALALMHEQVKNSLEMARDVAVQAAETKSEFLAKMSHEIRTPMNGVLGMLDLLKDTECSREQWDLLETAANSAEALLDIINDILDFSKLEAGKTELEKIEFDLSSLVEEVCALMAGRAHAKGLELNCFIPVNLPKRWHGDPTRIRQVLTNLIGNAVKFTEKGEVSINIREISTDESQSDIRIEVLDTGIGIAPEVQKQLFHPFAQADSSTARRFGGTGLGLSISRDLVRLMGGVIGLDSVLGQGTKFWFTLPLTAVASEVQTPFTDLSSHRALIVDDNVTNRIILEHYLKHWGLNVVQADNAETALYELHAAVLRGKPYTLLLSDLHMPDMDGLALVREINKYPNIAAIPKLILSSGGTANHAEYKALGISHCLLKPVRQTQLFDAVIHALKASNSPLNQTIKEENLVPDYQAKRVLVAEDNKVNQKVILAQLARYQLQPDVVKNGREALDKLAQQPYDLVLMDCQMPVMDGYEATRHLRALELTDSDSAATRLPIVALTAHAAEGEREKCLSAGMDDYLSKPVAKDKLAIILSRWLGEPVLRPAIADEENCAEHKLSSVWNETLALKQLDNDKDLLDDIILVFLDEIPAQLSALSEASENNDLTAVAEIAHRIKGMAGHFCANPIIDLAATLESSARNAEATDFKEMIEELLSMTRKLIENLLYRTSRGY